MIFNVIVTGAFGNVGQWVLTELVKQGHTVTALELRNPRTEKKQAELQANLKFDTVWADLTDAEEIKSIIAKIKPDAIAHVAAVIAPTAYVISEVAYKVNVIGTRNLIEAAESLENFHRFVFVSSYSVHGPQNPHKKNGKLTGDSPVNPGDNYGKHKIACEKRLEESSINWNVVRLPGVYSLDSNFGTAPEFMKFAFLLDPDRNSSAIDARDAGLGIANAISVEPVKRKFDICGDPAQGWTGSARDLTGPMMDARGLGLLPDKVYRRSDPNVDESWYYEGIVDPTESQKILQYQRHSFDEYISVVKKQAGISRYFLKLISPIVKRSLAKQSPYYNYTKQYDERPVWDSIVEHFGIDESKVKF